MNRKSVRRLTAILVGIGSVALVAGCSTSNGNSTSNELLEYVEQHVATYVGEFEPANEPSPDASGVKHWEFAVPDDPAAEPRGPLCLRGTQYTMETREGTSDELVIFLQGGGACWDTTCSAWEEPNSFVAGGVLDDESPDNPLADWDVVYMPSCDGAVYVGDVDRMLPPSELGPNAGSDELTMGYQRGLQNLTASLDIAKREFPAPSRVIIMGASAGAFGTIIGAPLVRYYYPDGDLLVFADSGVGVVNGDAQFVNETLLEGWNATHLIPDSCEGCTSNGHVTPMIEWNLERDPNLYISAFAFSQDVVLLGTFFGIGDGDYTAMLLEETGRISSRFPGRYQRMIADGLNHTVILRDTLDLGAAAEEEFLLKSLDHDVNGVSVFEWLTAMVDDTDAWVDVVDEAVAPGSR